MTPGAYLKMLLAVLDAEPADPAVQRLVVAAAALGVPARDRTAALSRVAALDHVDAAVLDGLARNDAPAVRAAAWRSPAWTPAQVRDMVSCEVPQVKLAALAHDDLGDDAYRAAAGWPSKALSRARAVAVLGAADLVPGDLLAAAVDALLYRHRHSPATAESEQLLHALTRVSVAEQFATDAARPLWVRLAAASSPHVPVAVVHATLCGAVAAGEKICARPENAFDLLGDRAAMNLLCERTDLTREVFDAAAEVIGMVGDASPNDGVDLGVAPDPLRYLVERVVAGRRDPHERGVAAMGELGSRAGLLSRWRSLEPAERSVEAAEVALSLRHADGALLDEVAAWWPSDADTDLDEVLQRAIACGGTNNALPGWVRHRPDLLLPRLRAEAVSVLPYTVRQLEPDTPHGREPEGVVVSLVLLDMAAHPELWSPGAMVRLVAAAGTREPSPEAVAVLSAPALVEAAMRSTPWPAALRRLAADLAPLAAGDGDGDDARMNAQALLPLLTTGQVPLADLVHVISIART